MKIKMTMQFGDPSYTPALDFSYKPSIWTGLGIDSYTGASVAVSELTTTFEQKSLHEWRMTAMQIILDSHSSLGSCIGLLDRLLERDF
jgi:hypothetical protein